MTLEDANKLIKDCAERMDSLYHNTVFDEWAIVLLSGSNSKLLSYLGPRPEQFQKNFLTDATALRAELSGAKHGIGDFEFTRHGVGTHFDAVMVLAEGVYLICNNTLSSMNVIAKDPRWLSAQVPFAELGDRFRADPLVYSA